MVCCTVAVLAATGAFGGSAKHDATPTTNRSEGFGIPDPTMVSARYSRDASGALVSLAVTVTPGAADRDARTELQVLHASPSASSGPLTSAKVAIVYQTLIAPSWSGTLAPSNWIGGCQTGVFRIRVVSVPAGTPLPDATAANSGRRSYGPAFTCTNN